MVSHFFQILIEVCKFFQQVHDEDDMASKMLMCGRFLVQVQLCKCNQAAGARAASKLLILYLGCFLHAAGLLEQQAAGAGCLDVIKCYRPTAGLLCFVQVICCSVLF
jgi:hypothetical protein